MNDTRRRILEVALDVLGQNPDVGMGEIATSAGVVRRTVYGYFPTRADLVRTLADEAATEVAALLEEVDAPARRADEVWADFIARLWPLVRRYRLLVSLRRGEYGQEIHAILAPIETSLAALVLRGQREELFGRHLPADALAQLAWNTVFTIADRDTEDGARAAAVTTLLLLGTSAAKANRLTSLAA